MQAVEVAQKPYETIQWPELHIETNWKISFAVFGAHLLALCMIALGQQAKSPPKPAKKLVVHTVTLQSTPRIVTQAQACKQDKKLAPPQASPTAAVPQQAPVEAQVEAQPVETPAEVQKEVQAEPPLERSVKIAPKTVAEEQPAPKVKAAPKPAAKVQPKPAAKTEKKPAKPKPDTKKPDAPKKETKKKEAPKAKKNDQAVKDKQAQQAKEKAAKQNEQKALQKKAEQAKAEQAAKVQAAKAQAAKQQAMIDKALSSLDSSGAIGGKKSTLAANAAKSAVAGPSAITSLSAESLVAFDASETAHCTPAERTYYDELVSRLKLALKLPEFGEVKLQLTINRSGKVVSVKSVKSKSKKNSDYVQTSIPKLHLPPFGQNFSGEKEHTFRLTLSNELNY